MKKRMLIALCCLPLLGTMLAFSPLAAEEPLPEGVSLEEFQAKVERKAEQNALEQEAFEQSLEGKISVNEVNPEGCADLINIVSKNLTLGGFKDYKTSHSGAWHFPVSVSGKGNHILLEDGSGWVVCELDAKKTLSWLASDTVLITLAPWYSWYDYVLVNCRNGARVRVTFDEVPPYYSPFTLLISEIDLGKGSIKLSDNTVWTTAPFSCLTIKGWKVGQKVILGINDRLFSSSYANFIVNEDANEFIKAKCLY
ncbi:MAG: hypothetical protein H0T62_08250 [Parachlamydiaceae bacterium]|nr:hypothetical protein [Parachlamydiaceae bacterium]